MDIQNHFYGHSSILAAYCGTRRVRHVRGLLQHGWTASSPLAVNFGDFPDVGHAGDDRRLLVWSHHSRAWSPQEDDRPSTAIGAPWLYVIQAAAADPSPPVERRPLVVPMHNTNVIRLEGDPWAMADFYFDAFGPATICLHSEDLKQRGIVEAWSRRGNEVVSAGDRFDPLFLPRQLTGMRRASRVVSNRLSTAVWYAVAAGVPASVFGPLARIPGESDAFLRSIQARWPELHGEDVPLEVSAPIAADELGSAQLRGRDELRDLLGWRGPLSTRAFGHYWVEAPISKAANVLGVRRRATHAQTAPAGRAGATPRAVDFLRHPLSHLPRPLPRKPWDGAPVDWVRPVAAPPAASQQAGPARGA